MRTPEENRAYQLTYYWRNRDKILEKAKDNVERNNQLQRNCYWRRKTGSTINRAFVKYIQQLLREDILMNQH
jgi:hypothetical protein